MKKSGHPKYQKVLFVDSASGYKFVTGSTLQPEAKEVFEGVEYPVSYLSISSKSHPLFTGSTKLLDSEGRVEKFNKRFGKAGSQANVEQQNQQQDQQKAEAAPQAKPAAAAKAPAKKAADKKAAEKPAKAKK